MGYYLVTGATGVLGKEFCRGLLAGERKELFLTGRSEEKLAALAAELKEFCPDAKIAYKACDLADPEDIEDMFRYSDERGMNFSGYFAIAGIDTQKAFRKYGEEKIIRQLRVNIEGNLLCFYKALDRFYKEPDTPPGIFETLIVSSMCGTVPIPYFSIYSASKAFLIDFYSAVRKELCGTHVTILVPGSIPTRPDVIADIEKQGLSGKLSSKSPAFVVKKALKGLSKNKRIVVPGFFNKMNYVLEKILPTKLLIAIMKNHWRRKEKDAF